MSKKQFTIRVYGIYHEPEKGILVTDELIHGKYVTKFPGGGLEHGEGTIDCLKREMTEETGYEFEVTEHFYTTDFFVASAFDSSYQVISIYYLIKPKEKFDQKISEKEFDFPEHIHGAQTFRYIKPQEITDKTFPLEIDRRVGEMIVKRF